MNDLKKLSVAIIGTGMLGKSLRDAISSKCKELLLTHNQHQYFQDSKNFNFFKDDIGQLPGFSETEVVIITAKIEFEEDSAKLEKSMRLFLSQCEGKRVIYVSSDGIFDGQRGLYTEMDIPSPITLYGRNLKICESLVQELASDYCIVRPNYLFGCVAGMLDSRTWKVAEALKRGEETRRFTDMFKSPLSYLQAAEAIASLALGNYKGIVHISGPRMSVFNLTKKAMEALNVPTSNLIEEPMPKNRLEDFLPDTSLDYHLMEELTGVVPKSIKNGF